MTKKPSTASDLSAADIGVTYGARRQVELIFKQLKSNHRIDDLPSSNRWIVESLLYASILTMVVSRKFRLRFLEMSEISPRRVPPSRWASIFCAVAHLLLFLSSERSTRLTVPDILDTWLRHAVDPNVSRRLTMRVVAP